MNPLELLHNDRSVARSRQDPCADVCTVANVDEHGRPQARILVLRDIEGELAIFVNATSPKWPRLAEVHVVVWLPSVKVQYRLACTTDPIAEHIVHTSWHMLPEPPKRMDWFYTMQQPQSSAVADRDELLARLAALDLEDSPEAPPTARGLYLRATLVERLDLAQANGVHDRRRYALADEVWQETVLVP